jgi:phage gp46-like protein
MLGVFLQQNLMYYDLRRDPTKGNHLETDQSLRTPILLSLFTEGRLQPEDVATGSPLGGWWGDSFSDISGWELGGRLFHLSRGKATAGALRLIEQETLAQLQWLIDDGLAEAVTAPVARVTPDRWESRVSVQVRGALAPEWYTIWSYTL